MCMASVQYFRQYFRREARVFIRDSKFVKLQNKIFNTALDDCSQAGACAPHTAEVELL